MRRALDLQTVASLAFLGSFVASEVAAWMLHAHPGSALAWWLNLGPFRAFEHARLVLRSADLLFRPASLPVALTLLAAVIVLRAVRHRLAIAIFANLSLMGSLVLLYGALGGTGARHVALTPAALLAEAELPLLLALIALIGAAASHWAFIRAIMTEAPPRPGRRLQASPLPA